MIKDRKVLGFHEVKEMLNNLKETDKTKELKAYIKKFQVLDSKKAEKLKEELKKMEIIKLKEADIIKIVDLCPENAVELNKVFTETSLDADETNKILGAIKNIK